MKIRTLFAFLFCIALLGSISEGSDWTHWRGPMQNGASPETGLISILVSGGRKSDLAS